MTTINETKIEDVLLFTIKDTTGAEFNILTDAPRIKILESVHSYEEYLIEFKKLIKKNKEVREFECRQQDYVKKFLRIKGYFVQ